MRLLAHGGNLLAERARFGSWPAIHPLLLEEKYGLSGSRKIFGVGTAGDAPFLIFRELQESGTRFYAFTLLLDPGQSVWEKANWNPTLLLEPFFEQAGSSDSVPALLLGQPERVTSAQLEAWLSELNLDEREPDLAPQDRVAECLAGAALSSDNVVVAPRDLQIPARPDLPSVRTALLSVPPAFRIGRGWMSGGGSAQAEAFGARVVFDDEAASTSGDLKTICSQGAQMIRIARQMVARPTLRNVLTTASFTPASKSSSAKSVKDSLQLLSDWLTHPEQDNALIRTIATPDSGPLASLTRAAAEVALREGQGTLDAATTRALLRYFVSEKRSATEYLPRIDPKTLADFVRSECGGEAPEFLGLPNTLALTLRIADLEAATGNVVPLLKRIFESSPWSQGERTALLQSAWKRFAQLKEPLRDWKVFEDQPEWPTIQPSVVAEAGKRSESRAPASWMSDYLTFGDPLQATAVLWKVSEKDAPALVQLCLEALKEGNPAAENLLNALATSNLRRVIDVPTKLQVSKSLRASRAWDPFWEVAQVMRGERIDELTIVDKAELPMLRAELLDLPFGSTGPDLVALMKCNGLLDKQTFNGLAKRVAAEGRQNSPQWREGLSQAFERKWINASRFEEELLQSMEADIRSGRPVTVERRSVNDAALEKWLRGHLCAAEQPSVAVSGLILKQVCQLWGADDHFREILGLCFKDLSAPEQKLFSQRFFPADLQSTEIESIFTVIPEEFIQNAAAALCADDRQPVVELFRSAVAETDETAGACRIAILRFIASPEDHPSKRSFAKSDYRSSKEHMRKRAQSLLDSLEFQKR